LVISRIEERERKEKKQRRKKYEELKAATNTPIDSFSETELRLYKKLSEKKPAMEESDFGDSR
jgi:hypothetical protein